MKVSELRNLSADELKNKEEELRRELFNLKIRNATGQLENSARISLIKRDIARIKTILRERELKKEQAKSRSDSQE